MEKRLESALVESGRFASRVRGLNFEALGLGEAGLSCDSVRLALQ